MAGFVSQLLDLNCLLHWTSPTETELGSHVWNAFKNLEVALRAH